MGLCLVNLAVNKGQGANVGEIIVLCLNGWFSERFGYRYTVIACLTLIIAWTALFFTAQNVQTLLAAEILCGIVRITTSGICRTWLEY